MPNKPSLLDDDYEPIDDTDGDCSAENDPCDRCECSRYLHDDGKGECTCGKCRKFVQPG